MRRLTLVLLILFQTGSLLSAGKASEPDTLFSGFDDGAFVLYDGNNGQYQRYRPERCEKRLSPCSTFKIANALIALECGVLTNPDSLVLWDSIAVPRRHDWPKGWAGDQTLFSAMRNSVVWYFQRLARLIGPDQYKTYLAKIDYGNRDISGGLDRFWLISSLKISANEQVRFLQRFHDNVFGFSDRSVDIVKKSILLEQGEDYAFYGKTGAGKNEDGSYLGWLVGFVETADNTWYYALNLTGKDYNRLITSRINIARKILQANHILSTPGNSED